MRWLQHAALALGVLCISPGMVHAAGVPTANCALQNIRFQASASSLKGIQYVARASAPSFKSDIPTPVAGQFNLPVP